MAEVTIRTALANIDIRGMIGRLDRMRLELARSQSADMPNGMMEADKLRLADYIGDIRSYWNYVNSKPVPDCPEAHGVWSMSLPDDKDVGDPDAIENEDIRQMLFLMAVMRIEMANSQSARLVQGFIPVSTGHPGDIVRFSDAISRIENFAKYVATTQPSDRPESTPSEAPVKAGMLGT